METASTEQTPPIEIFYLKMSSVPSSLEGILLLIVAHACSNWTREFCPLIPQASQAAQEAEDNARKAKNSVNSLLHMINDLLGKLGMYPLS